jgi:Divergent InlB B-repeat domain
MPVALLSVQVFLSPSTAGSFTVSNLVYDDVSPDGTSGASYSAAPTGQTVTVTATPAAGYTFVNWTWTPFTNGPAGSSSANAALSWTAAIGVAGAGEITANFIPTPPTAPPMSATDQLIDEAKCIERCVPPGMLLPVLVALFAKIVGMNTTDTNALIAQATCIDQCIPKGMQLPVLISLAQEIVNNTAPLPAILAQYGFLSLHSTQTVVIASPGTYVAVKNYTDSVVSGFTADLVNGTLTCALAGFYRVFLGVSFAASASADSVDADLFINGLNNEFIASHSTAPTGANKYQMLGAEGIMQLNVGDTLSIALNDSTQAATLTLVHAQLVVTGV